MGRYYSGDIEGKFWFAIQSSDDADNFGVDGEPIYDEDGDETGGLEYNFTESDIPSIEEGIQKCLEVLGEEKKRIDDFFAEGGPGHTGYTDEMLMEYLGVNGERAAELLVNYARLGLGNQILDCVREIGSCIFEAEL